MGNSTVRIRDHCSSSGSVIPEDPPVSKATFICVSCGRELYDGGLCQGVECPCGLLLRRTETDEIIQVRPCLGAFSDQFEWCSSKGHAKCIDLAELTLGVFEDDLQCYHVLFEFFGRKMRCVRKGDLFAYGNYRFKVLSAFPSHGYVTRKTRIQVTQMLFCRNLEKIKLVPKYPHRFSDDIFEPLVYPYFYEKPLHLHTHQELSLNGLKCIVSKAEPSDGLIGPDTIIEYSEEPKPFVKHVKVLVYENRFVKRMAENERFKFVVGEVVGYFKGWSRIVRNNQEVSLDKFDFKIEVQENGVVNIDSEIEYDGKFILRSSEDLIQQNQVLIERVLQMMETIKSIEQCDDVPGFLLEKIPSEQRDCLICQSSFEVNVEVKALPCLHIFHSDCISKWLHRSNSCPVCKTSCQVP